MAGTRGVKHGDVVLARYTKSGLLDPSFGRRGTVVTDLGSSHGATAVAAALQPDGKVVVAGGVLFGAGVNSGLYAVVARFTASGSLDPTFGRAGKALVKLESARTVAIQPDGNIVATGNVGPIRTGDKLAIFRLTRAGRFDPTFGRNGETVANFDSNARGLALQPDGRILVAGRTANSPARFGVSRFAADGTLDTTFGEGGVARTAFTSAGGAAAVGVEPDGKIVAGGISGGDFAVVRYGARGELDRSFGAGGTVTTAFGPAWPSAPTSCRSE